MTHLDPNQIKLIGQGHSSKLKFGKVKYSIVGKKKLKKYIGKISSVSAGDKQILIKNC